MGVIFSLYNNKVVLSDIQREKGKETVEDLKKLIPNCDVAFVQSSVADEQSVRGNTVPFNS